MKKLFITTAIATILSFSAFAADGGKKADDASNVSYSVINQFNAEFRGAKDVTWTITNNCQKAAFVLDEVKMTAFYNLSGEFLGTTQNIEFKKLPAAAQKEIAATYKNYEVGEVIKYQLANQDYGYSRAYTREPESVVYFVDLKNDSEELIVRVTPQADVYFFKQVK